MVMGLIESHHPDDEMGIQGDSWETLRAGFRQHPDEYQAILEMVPSWGQELLVRLHGHHPDSLAHSVRVAATIDAVLERRSFGDIPHESVTLAALLHDVGKYAVPLGILDKDGPLTDGEREEVKPHVVQSFLAIKPHDLLVAQLAGGHHLYQRDAYGHEGAKSVPWDAAVAQQVIAVADVVDALGSKRSYKPAWTRDFVRSTLMDERNHFPFLIDRVLDARFSIPPFDRVSQDTPVVSPKNTIFIA